MSDGIRTWLDFRQAVERNRTLYALNRQYPFFALAGLIESTEYMGSAVESGRNANGKSFASLLPFFLLFSRQLLTAFDFFTTCRSHQGWLLFRPGLEALLIAGKWVDDPAYAQLWEDRQKRRDEYRKAFTGKGLVSVSLGDSDRLQKVLATLNDNFPHANQEYYFRHTSLQDHHDGLKQLRVEFFDDDDGAEAHTIALLHLAAIAIQASASMLASHLTPVPTPPVVVGPLEAALVNPARDLRRRSSDAMTVVRDLGLWELQT